MHADCAFTIGSTHKVCQDYALSGTSHAGPFAIVSDGCSGSPDTDIGARLLAKVGEAAIRVGIPLKSRYLRGHCEELYRLVFGRVLDVARPHAFDATLLAVFFSPPDAQVAVAIAGDGAAAYRGAHGELRGVRVRAADNLPPYLSYGWSAARDEAHRAASVPREVIQAADESGIPLGHLDPYWLYPADAEVVAIFSDGVESFHDAEGAQVDPRQVVQELMAFKTYPGAFVQRRVQAFLRECTARGWTHHDDLAMAAVYLGEG